MQRSTVTNPALVYVISPYTARSIAERDLNIKMAEEMGKRIFRVGGTPIICHTMTKGWERLNQFNEIPHTVWLDNYCLPLLDIAHLAFVSTVSQIACSEGCQKELIFCINQNIPVIEWGNKESLHKLKGAIDCLINSKQNSLQEKRASVMKYLGY